jgi:hypothetical protein
MSQREVAIEKLLDSTNSSLQHMEKENIKLKYEVQLLEAKLAMATQGKETSETMIHDHLEKMNAQNHEYLEEIQRLRGEIRRLKKEA